MGPYSNAFSLDSINERWTGMQAAPAEAQDPFAHLSGMEKARAQADYAQQISAEAVTAYIDDLSAKLLASNPDFVRINVGRKTDAEYGTTFVLESVEDRDGNVGDVDLEALQGELFHDHYLDRYVSFEEESGDLYIDLSHGETGQA
jgi:hypothetical protein